MYRIEELEILFPHLFRSSKFAHTNRSLHSRPAVKFCFFTGKEENPGVSYKEFLIPKHDNLLYLGGNMQKESLYDKAIRIIAIHEGGYVNDPDDLGGETIFGITRKNYPNMSMWKDVDRAKKIGTISKSETLKKIRADHLNEILNVYRSYVKKADEAVSMQDEDLFIGTAAFFFNAGLSHYNNLKSLSKDDVKSYVVNHYNNIMMSRPANRKFRNGWQRRIRETFNDQNLTLWRP